MTNVTAQQVKELRDATNISMMECKRALVEANGDFDGALKVLRERGLAVAHKRADKEANEGAVVALDNAKGSYMLVVGCETDFVANSNDFRSLCDTLLKGYVSEGESYVTKDATVSLITETIAKCGEKMVVTNHASFSNNASAVSASYIHGNSKIGVLVELETDSNKPEIKQLAKDLAMQVAAMKPIAISQNDVSQEMRDEQVAIFTKQLKEEGKPADMVEKIVVGKVNKYFSEFCLEDMIFIKDGKMKVKELVSSIQKTSGASKLKISKYRRFQIGA